MAPFKKKDDKPTNKRSHLPKAVKHVTGAWILVPRRGRDYYFNTATGESVWELNEVLSPVGSSRANQTRKYTEPTSGVDKQLHYVNPYQNYSGPVNNTTPQVVNQSVIPPYPMYWPMVNYPLFGPQMPNVMPPMISQNWFSNQMTSNMMPPVYSSNGMSNQITSNMRPPVISSNGRSNQMTSNMRPPVISSKGMSNKTTSNMRPPVISKGMSNKTTSNMRPPVISSKGMSNKTTSNMRPPVISSNGMSNETTSNMRPPVISSKGMSNKTTSNMRPPVISSKAMSNKTTSNMRPPVISSKGMSNKTTSNMRPPVISSKGMSNKTTSNMRPPVISSKGMSNKTTSNMRPPVISSKGMSNKTTSNMRPPVISSKGMSNKTTSNMRPPVISSKGMSNKTTSNMRPPVISSNGMSNETTSNMRPPVISSKGMSNKTTSNMRPPVISSKGMSNKTTSNMRPPVYSSNGMSNETTSNMRPPVISSNGRSNQMSSNIPPSVYPQAFEPSLFLPQTVAEIPLSISQKFKQFQQGRLNQVKKNDVKKKMIQYTSNDLRIKLMIKKKNQNQKKKNKFPETEPVQPMELEEPNQLDNEVIESQERLEENVKEDGEQHAHESNCNQHLHRDVSNADISDNNATELATATEAQIEVIEEKKDVCGESSRNDLTVDNATELDTVHQIEVIKEGIDVCGDDSYSDDKIIDLDLTPVYEKYKIKTDKVFYVFADTEVFINNLNFLVMFVNSGPNFRLIISKHLLNELQMVALDSIESLPNEEAARGWKHLTDKIRAGTAIYVEDLMTKIVKYRIGWPASDNFMLTSCLWLNKAGEQYTFLTHDKVLFGKSKISKVNVVLIDDIMLCIGNQITQIGTDTFIKREQTFTTTIEQTREPIKHIQIDNRSLHSEETIKISDTENQQHQQPTTVTRQTNSQTAIVPEPQNKVVCQPQVNIHNNITPTNQQPANNRSNQMSHNNVENIKFGNHLATDAWVKSQTTILRNGGYVFSDLNGVSSSSDMLDDNVNPDIDRNETYHNDTVNNDGNETHHNDTVNNDGNETHHNDTVNNDGNETQPTDGETKMKIQTDCNNDDQQTTNTESPQLTDHQQIVSEGSKSTITIRLPIVKAINKLFIQVRAFCLQVQLNDNSLSSEPKKLHIKKQTEVCQCMMNRLMGNIDGILERENRKAETNPSINQKYRERMLICKQHGTILLEALSYIASEIQK